MRLLDKDFYTEEQIRENYVFLIEKWGEWEIVGAETAGVVVRYVDIRNALFSGLMITYTILCLVSFTLAIVIGKVICPILIKYYTNNNDELVDMATLKTAAKVDASLNDKKSEKEWF